MSLFSSSVRRAATAAATLVGAISSAKIAGCSSRLGPPPIVRTIPEDKPPEEAKPAPPVEPKDPIRTFGDPYN